MKVINIVHKKLLVPISVANDLSGKKAAGCNFKKSFSWG